MKEKNEKYLETKKTNSIEFIESYFGKKLVEIDLKTISELPDEFFRKLVETKDFGQIARAENFLSAIKRQAPFDRIISILAHIVDLHPINVIYTQTQSFLLKEFYELEYNQPKSKSRDSKLYDLQTYKDSCNDFLNNYYYLLSNELQSSTSVFKSINLLKSVEYLIDSNSSVINQNNDCLMLSPALFPFKHWSQLLIRELSLLHNEALFNLNIEKFISLFKDLAERIGSDNIPTLESRVCNTFENGEFIYEPLFLAHTGFNGFNLKISDYIRFLESVEFKDIKETNLELLRKTIVDEEKRKERILQKLKNSKIEVSKNKNHLKKGLKYLLKKTNPKVDATILEKITYQVLSELFHYDTKKESFKIPSEIVFDNQLLLEYIVFLEKYDYIKYNSQISVPKVISKNCTLQIKGLTQSNLYNILKTKLAYHPDNISEIRLTFKGLTSELALLNEIRN